MINKFCTTYTVTNNFNRLTRHFTLESTIVQSEKDHNMLHLPSLAAIPAVGQKRIAIRIKKSAERIVRSGHPWLFDRAITSESHAGVPGDLAVLFDHKRDFLGIGLYDPDSPIRVKLLHAGPPVRIDEAWFCQTVEAAVARRVTLLQSDTTGYRLIYGEGDYLPGLIVDRYGPILVIKLYTAAWLPHLATICRCLQAETGAALGILRLSRRVAAHKPLYGLRDGAILWESQAAQGDLDPTEARFVENGIVYQADLLHGHKTGFFFDHRENRARVRDLAAGRRMLDLYAYTGGFSLSAAVGGAREVISVDISRPALDAAEFNFELNLARTEVARTEHRTVCGDLFDVVKSFQQQGERFDLIVVDPPAFAKREAEIGRALNAYAHLTREVLPLLERNGAVLFGSCTARITPEQFYNTVFETAARSGRPLEAIATTGHGVDHPVRPEFPEGRYLKAILAQGV